MDEKNPLVSIIVRTKDRPELLKKTLQSIASQTYRPIEVVLVNDGGCDLDVEELKTILDDVSLNYIRLEKNTGRANAGNVGIENAKGEYIGFLDDDDEFYPEHVAALTNFLTENGLKVAYSDSLMVYKEENKPTKIRKELVFSQDFDYDRLIFENYIPFMCLLFDREVLSTSGGFDTNFELYEDWDLLIRVGEKYPFHHLRKITAEYNQWCSVSQIAQCNKNFDFLKTSYTKILFKHSEKLNPQRIYNYINNHINLVNKIRELKREFNISRGSDEDIQYIVDNIKDMKRFIEESRFKLTEFQRLIKEKDMMIEMMRETFGWKMLEKYRMIRNRIIEGVYIKNTILKVFHIFKKQGIIAVIKKVLERVHPKKTFDEKLIRRSIKTVDIPGILINNSIDIPITQKVSIVIPVKDAGEEFEFNLRKIKWQKGIKDIELVIIDSGSQDGTVEISKRYTDKVFQIAPNEFHHAGTRNLGAERATGEFIVFMVQDAIPVGDRWLYRMIHPIIQGEASAVTPKQIPRSDADLYSGWAVWGHNKYMCYDRDRIYDSSFKDYFTSLDLQYKRAMVSLNNVCLALRKSIFDAYKFRSSYAEDLELGIRLLKDGHALMFQSSNAVIHSHNRSAMYFFKRSYVDTIFLLDLLNISRMDLSEEYILKVISCFYTILKVCIIRFGAIGEYQDNPKALIDLLVHDMDDKLRDFNTSWKFVKGNAELDDYFDHISPIMDVSMLTEIRSLFYGNLYSFSEFMSSFGSISVVREDFINSIYKFFGNVAGHYLGIKTNGKIDYFLKGV
jgi:glycosyltransferase involved in cell wall biosynthesis